MNSPHHPPNDVFMNVKQVSAYLQINQKKVYDMVNRGIIPATKITGKWMFPKELIDKWMLDSTHNGLLRDRLTIAGNEDPFLSRVINNFSRQLGNKAVIACSNTSTHAGLELLNANRVDVCCLHWGPAAESRTRHPSLIQQYSSSASWILIHAFQREQGLLFRATGAHEPVIEDFFAQKFRWDVTSSGSGTQRFLLEVLSKNGLVLDDLNTTSTSMSDREAAAAIHLNRCDVAPGTRATATEFGLQFLALGTENFDFVIPRDIWFRHLFQHLVEKIDSEPGHRLAQELGGYHIENCGKLIWGDD